MKKEMAKGKGRVNISLSMTRKAFYTLVVLIIMAFVGMGVGIYAFGTTSPSTFGHSAKELNLSGGVEGNAIFNGNVGVGLSNPSVKLEVNGDLKVGNSGIACDSLREGAIRYNSVNKTIEFCDGQVGWKELK